MLDLSDSQARTVARPASIVHTRAGRSLLAEGVHRLQLVWLLSGHAIVAKGGQTVAVLGPGDRLRPLAERRLAA